MRIATHELARDDSGCWYLILPVMLAGEPAADVRVTLRPERLTLDRGRGDHDVHEMDSPDVGKVQEILTSGLIRIVVAETLPEDGSPARAYWATIH